MEERNDSKTLSPFEGIWVSLRAIFSTLFQVPTLVSDLNLQSVGMWDRNPNHNSVIRNTALKIFKKSIKMVWNYL